MNFKTKFVKFATHCREIEKKTFTFQAVHNVHMIALLGDDV